MRIYHHILVETTEKEGKNKTNKQYFEYNKTDFHEIEKKIIIPFFGKEKIRIDGYFLDAKDIIRLVVKCSSLRVEDYCSIENNKKSFYIFRNKDIFLDNKYLEDITEEVLDSVSKKQINKIPKKQTEINIINDFDKTKVFIVHGHDNAAKSETARFIEKMGLKAIILHEQVSSGKTIIEKIEEYSNVGFGIVLYTPCDLGAKKENSNKLQARARQNVIFEHGYLTAKLGRKNVCALIKNQVEIPNDLSGVVYTLMDADEGWQLKLAKELKAAGYDIDFNLL